MNHIATIEIPKVELLKFNDLLLNENIDYDKEGFGELQTIKVWTARFDNGNEVDLKVNTNNREDKDCYAEMVLFSPRGSEISHSQPEYELDGPAWYLDDGEDTYSVIVIGV